MMDLNLVQSLSLPLASESDKITPFMVRSDLLQL